MINQFVYELYLDDCKVYKNSELNYVFHEYLNYMNENNNSTLLIKKKLQDDNKKYTLYLETIIYNSKNLSFYSVENDNYYHISNCSYLSNLVNLHTFSSQKVQVESNNCSKENICNTKVLNKKIVPIKTHNKVKVIDFNTNTQTNINVENSKKTIQKEVDNESDVDDEKLEELQKMIKDLEEMKDDNLNELKEKEEIILNKEMEERFEKSKERTINEKRKELNNIFEADRRLYLNFKEIITEIQKQKEDIENGIIDKRRPSELKKHELTARMHVINDKEFEIPILFKHKFPIFEFMNQNKLLDNDKSFLVFKTIYYNNYELDTESRKYFGNKVYLLNDEEYKIFEEIFNDEQKILIREFTKFLNRKTLNIEKLISDSLNNSKKEFSKISSNNDYNNMFEKRFINNSDESDEENNDNESDEDDSTIYSDEDNESSEDDEQDENNKA
jgi:hypothetical protein